jgi:hypothetical protein
MEDFREFVINLSFYKIRKKRRLLKTLEENKIGFHKNIFCLKKYA